MFLLGITALLALAGPAGAVTYTYDQLGRVTEADYGGGKTVTYAYDAAGNRTAQTIIANSANLIWTATVGSPAQADVPAIKIAVGSTSPAIWLTTLTAM